MIWALKPNFNLLIFTSPEQVLRDVRGSVHQERPAAQVPAAGRRLPAGLRQRVGVAGPPADQKGTAAAAAAGPARQDLIKLIDQLRPPFALHGLVVACFVLLAPGRSVVLHSPWIIIPACYAVHNLVYLCDADIVYSFGTQLKEHFSCVLL